MEKEDLVSVVVPVYNVEKYVGECLQSLIEQTYINIEIIIVIDGSTDKSEKICEEYGKEDGRIRIIKQENKGLSEARNTGIDNAKGEYITFVDSDDWLEKNAIFNLMDVMLKKKVDIVVGKILITDIYLQNNNIQKAYFKEKNKKEFGHSLALEQLFSGKLPAYAWGKLYDISLFKEYDIRFTPQIHYEDIDIMYRLLDKAQKIATFDQCIYHYRVRQGSITNVYKINDVEDLLGIQSRIVEYFKSTAYAKQEIFAYYQLSLLFLAYSILCKTGKDEKRKGLFTEIHRRQRRWKLTRQWYWHHRTLPMVNKIIGMKMGIAGIVIKLVCLKK